MNQANTSGPVTIANAMEYSTGGEMAYQVDYSDGTQVRAVFGRDGWARKEWKNARGEWVQVGRPYVVKSDRKRTAERLRAAVVEWLK